VITNIAWWRRFSAPTRPIFGESCASTRPITTSAGLTAPCTQPRRSNRYPNRSISTGIASGDRPASVA
jgi:hypothetical protein